ncbi:MAG: VWA domain-containing protein [Bacteroidales bacterium]|nr:VWA domain-containing protein [Bacteroidales bacterium]
MAQNEMQWSSATPGLLIILVDQSGSMMNPYCDGDSRTEFSAKVINRVINTIIKKNFNKDKPKNRCFISVIGYGYEVKELCSGFLEDLYNNPIRVENRSQKVPDGNGGLVDVAVNQPIWVEPIKEDRWTNMRDGFKMAKQLVEDWIADKPECPAPVIINISDGEPYYDHLDVDTCIRETTDVAKQIMSISNKDGNVLIFNAEIGDGGHKIITPSSEAEVASAGRPAQFLYEISSVIPAGYKDAAAKNELSIKEGSKGCIFNADAVELIQLIDFGSSKGQGDK